MRSADTLKQNNAKPNPHILTLKKQMLEQEMGSYVWNHSDVSLKLGTKKIIFTQFLFYTSGMVKQSCEEQIKRAKSRREISRNSK